MGAVDGIASTKVTQKVLIIRTIQMDLFWNLWFLIDSFYGKLCVLVMCGCEGRDREGSAFIV